MQEEVNDRTIALCVRTARMTTGVLRSALMMLLREKYYRSRYGANRKDEPEITVHGRKSMKELMDEGSELTNIEITDSNIKSFEKVARKYSIDYSLKKDNSMDPPRYIVFFRARDVDVMTAAFREYTGISMNKQQKKSVSQRLQKALDRTKVISHRERDRSKEKNRGFER
jgi:hypothetical protein